MFKRLIDRMYRKQGWSFYYKNQRRSLYLSYPGAAEVKVLLPDEGVLLPHLVMVNETGIHFYNAFEPVTLTSSIPREALRWFGRIAKYQLSGNALWIHAEIAGAWRLTSIVLDQAPMQNLVRALKKIATPEQVKAYRRQRPYIHHGPVMAWNAVQDIHGAWTLGEAVALYVTPSHLVFFDPERVPLVLRAAPLETVQQVEVLPRLDAPGGLVRFRITEERFALAFAPGTHLAFGRALADAAKRSLEEPVLLKRKGKAFEDE